MPREVYLEVEHREEVIPVLNYKLQAAGYSLKLIYLSKYS